MYRRRNPSRYWRFCNCRRDYTGKVKRTLNGRSDAVLSVTISPDAKILASGSADQTIRLWDLKTWEQWWEILGLNQSDNANVIKLAYRRLARQYHFDINSSASQKL
ncbi:WD40 repeat domain-containing protein [Nostoc sp.]|uniref:WD40 repeat domain-containing protein n=1 Tax=Nostoc sp. TaxID=1180 RepID=UPI002FF909D2